MESYKVINIIYKDSIRENSMSEGKEKEWKYVRIYDYEKQRKEKLESLKIERNTHK